MFSLSLFSLHFATLILMSIDPIEIVANRIRDLRTKKNWSQEQLAEKSGLHRTYIGAVERGERNITLRTLNRIAQALDCEMTVLLQTEPKKTR